MNAAQQEVMRTAHTSWEVKQRLTNEVVKAVEALAVNVYTEYSTFRGCSPDGAYAQANEYTKLLCETAREIARNAVAMQVGRDRGR